jgi:hypothetical protein
MSWFDAMEEGGFDPNTESSGILAGSYDSSGDLSPVDIPNNQVGITYQQEMDIIASQGGGVTNLDGSFTSSPWWSEAGALFNTAIKGIASTGAAIATGVSTVKNAGATVQQAVKTPATPQQTANNLGYQPKVVPKMNDATKLALLGLGITILLKMA